MNQMRFAEFFAGIGLVRMGLERSGWKCAFANDIDEGKREMYFAQFPDAAEHFECGDIRRVDASKLPDVDLATASFPCTDLSLAGGRAGLAGKASSALWPFLELLQKLEQLRPRMVMLENVTGFLTSHGGADFKSVLTQLNRLGYAVDAFVLDASSFVPQSRQRLFVIGQLDLNLLVKERVRNRPLKFFESSVRPPLLADFILHTQGDIVWRLRELPDPPTRTTTIADIVETLPDDAPEWWSPERTEYLLNQMSPRHLAIAEGMIKSEATQYGTVFRRVRNGRSMAELRTDGTAGCLRTPKGGSGRQILFAAGSGMYRARLMTPRECARLMGAGEFNLTVPLNQALFGFGDAVCVDVIDWIACNYLNPALEETAGSARLSYA